MKLDLDARHHPPKAMAEEDEVSSLKNELIDYENWRPVLPATGRRHWPRRTPSTSAGWWRRAPVTCTLDLTRRSWSRSTCCRRFPTAAATYRRKFRHVLVDEYQDTNHAQYVLIRTATAGVCSWQFEQPVSLGRPRRRRSWNGAAGNDARLETARPGRDLAGTGGGGRTRRQRCLRTAWWATPTSRSMPSAARRCATTPRNIDEFERDFAGARVILLEQLPVHETSWRPPTPWCPVTPAGCPDLWSEAGDGPPITGYVADSEHDEAAFVAQQVDRLADEGEATPGQVAVFRRTNAQSRVFEEVFIRAGLPYKVVGGVRFYERREIRDLLAYLRLMANPGDEVSLRRVLNVPKRGIGDRAQEYVAAFAARQKMSFAAALARPQDVSGLAARSVKAIAAFNELITGLRALPAGPAGDLAEAVLDRTGYVADLSDSSDLQDRAGSRT